MAQRRTSRCSSTTTGGGSGRIPAVAAHVNVTSADVNNIITLPFADPGSVVTIANSTTGYELRSSDPLTIGINNGKAANAEAAIPASVLVTCTCVTATNWVCSQTTAAGVVSATEVAAP